MESLKWSHHGIKTHINMTQLNDEDLILHGYIVSLGLFNIRTCNVDQKM